MMPTLPQQNTGSEQTRRLPAVCQIPIGTSFFASPEVALADILDEACELFPEGSLTAVVAWASVEGAHILWDITDRRVAIEQLLIGVARGGTDRAALFAARSIAGSAFVFLDGRLSASIAHFKVYRFRGRGGRRLAIVGSANLTRGGLLDNQETAMVVFDDGAGLAGPAAVLDQIDTWIAERVGSPFSHPVTDGLIATLVQQRVVPAKHPRSERRRRDLAEFAGDQERRPYTFRTTFSPIIVPPYDGPDLSDEDEFAPMVPDGTPAVPPRTRWQRFVRYYGTSESNRTRSFRGTHEFNLAMPERRDQEFWGYPVRFAINDSGMSDQREISVRFTAGMKSEVIANARVYRRLRDTGSGDRAVTEARLRPLTARAMRTLYDGIKITPDALLVVERGTGVDYEIRVVLPDDPEYGTLAPAAGLRQAYSA